MQVKKAKVFLDTNILLKAFLSYRKLRDGEIDLSEMPPYLVDEESTKFTFEKCIYEGYLAFMGVGGKKPDEGKGDWANRFLKKINDPNPLSNLISKYHSNNKGYTFYWKNQIEEVSIEKMKEDINIIHPNDKEKFKADINKLEELKLQHELFLNLCDDFNAMIQMFRIETLTYLEIFGVMESNNKLLSFELPTTLDSFVRKTVIPSEDFEVIYSAERIAIDIFVTDDKRLITCSKSLGLNSFLTPSAFCTGDEYLEKKLQWKENRMSSKLE